LFFALMYKDRRIFDIAVSELSNLFGNLIEQSEVYNFNFTKFYEKEFGKDLKKTIVVFDKNVDNGTLVNINEFIEKMEIFYSLNGKRRINIDPGYFNKKEVVLASNKKKRF